MSLEPQTVSWQKRIFALLWTGYASYYLCRMNFAVAQPEMLREFTSWDEAKIGLIPSVYAAFYALGQFVNGQIGSKIGARRMMASGLGLIAVINVLFAQTSSYPLMLVLWAVNGYCQSIGWPLVVQTMSNWFRAGNRGTVMGLISTCYQVGNVLAWLLAGFLTGELGWRAAFWVPGLALLPVALLLFVRLRDKPEDAGLPHIRDDEAPPLPAATAAPAADLSVWDIIRLTLSSRVLWILAVSYFCFNAVRYAFMNWSVQYFAAFHSIDIKGSALRAVAFPLVGALGAISSGWVSDRFFQGRRAPVCSLMLLVLGGLCLLLIVVPAGQPTAATALIALAGFMIYGPDAILSGAAAIDLAHPKAAASATGFIMAMGNLGNAIFSGVGVGFVLTQTGGSWTWVFSILSALSVAAAAMAARLWNEKPRRRP